MDQLRVLLNDSIENILHSDRHHSSDPSLPLSSAPTKNPPDLVSQRRGLQSKELPFGHQLPHLLPARLPEPVQLQQDHTCQPGERLPCPPGTFRSQSF